MNVRRFRIEVNGKVHEVKVEEVKEEAAEAHAAVIAAAIAAYIESEEGVALPPLVSSSWKLAGRYELMAPVSGGRKVPRWARAAPLKWSLAGRRDLMRQTEWEVWHEEI